MITPSIGSLSTGNAVAVQAFRRDAARLLGADDSVAQQFGSSGMVLLGDTPLSLQPLQDDPAGPWIAFTQAQRPAEMPEDTWCDALLRATRHCMTVTHAAYGLSDRGDAVVTLRMPAGYDHADLLAAEMAGLLNLRQALLDGVRAPVKEPPATPPADMACEQAVHPREPSSNAQEFEAPDDVLGLVHAALLHLGFSLPQAQAAIRTGELRLKGMTIGLACDGDTPTLVVAADLGEDTLNTPDERKQALQANAGLMASAGVAMAREQGRTRLMARCDLDRHSAEVFANWLDHFARLAQSTVAHRLATALH
jgi:hypothetical protein